MNVREDAMIKGIFNTLGGKYVAERRMEMISNNIANSLTPGYKTSGPVVNMVRAESDIPGAGPTYTSVIDSYVHFTEAPLMQTGATLDVAVDGDGFFVVATPEGTRYTRNGQFTLSKEKKLVTMDGSPVLGQSGEITLDGKDIVIENDGSIFVDRNLVDNLKVVDFKDKRSLRPYGRSMFFNTDSSNTGITPEKYAIKQGAYETSNVDVIKELVEMISSIRAYESYTKVDQSFGDTMSKLLEVAKV
jgi:flagellar basal-body rod protein FlgF